ncbi:TPA: hypothetical protein KKX52_002706 [Legionella pneumophila]|nr:hypothetical protein [Legionella pneumophila]
MDWINKNQGVLMLILVLVFGIWNIYLTYKTNSREESTITKKSDELIAKLEERVERAQEDIEKASNTIQMIESKMYEIDKNVAVIEEKLKNATIKSLMAAGATKKQSLQFWDSKSTYMIPSVNPTPKIELKKQ